MSACNSSEMFHSVSICLATIVSAVFSSGSYHFSYYLYMNVQLQCLAYPTNSQQKEKKTKDDNNIILFSAFYM